MDTAELVNRGCDKDLNLHLFESNYATTDKSYDLNAPVPPVDVEIRGFIYTYAHALFQVLVITFDAMAFLLNHCCVFVLKATFPSHYREQRFGHHYGNINFGLLDIYVDSAEEEVLHRSVFVLFYTVSDGSTDRAARPYRTDTFLSH